MAYTKPVTELDFDLLKAEIKDYIKNNPTFTDYNFEGSALSTILDILAYNTHANAYLANMLHSEGFLDTAQKRSSVVSKAKELGYVPKSARGSSALVNLTITGVSNPYPLVLSAGSIFTASNDTTTYSFITSNNYTSTFIAGLHNFYNVKLVEGVNASNYFKVNTAQNVRSIFTIPNKDIDTTTLKVFVRDSLASTSRTEFSPVINVFDLKSTSTVFFLQESYDGYYEIFFGSDVLGKQPVNGNIIEVEYVVATNKAAANGCKSFTFQRSLGLSSSVTTIQSSIGGSEKETIESIKFNAVKANAAKNRAVTESDYSAIIKDNLNFIKSSLVWGGETNNPPVYGKVFIAVQPQTGLVITDQIKRETIIPTLKKYCTMGTTIEVVDPSYTTFEFVTRIKFDKSKTTMTQSEVEAAVKLKISSYIAELSKFGSIYLESTLISRILSISSAIASVSIQKRVGFNLSPTYGVLTNFSKQTNNKILPGTLLSEKFTTYRNGKTETVYFRDLATTTQTAQIALFLDSGIQLENIGTVNLETGYFNFNLSVSSYSSGYQYIPVRFGVVNDDFQTKHNQIIILDSEAYTYYTKTDNVVLFEAYAN